MIEIRHLHFSYGEKEILRDINLDIKKGEVFGLLGPNGAGKSTLILHLNGILKPKKGEILIDGLNPVKNPREVRKKVGIVFQDPNDQLFSPTVFEDVAFGPYNLGLRGKELEERVYKALRFVGMEKYADREIKHLSFGEKKRIAIATVLAMDPKILVFDEPFANLDFRGKEQVRTLIEQFRGEKTIILASHEAEYLTLCDKIALIDEGKIIKVGTPEEILGDVELLKAHNLDVPPLIELFLSLNLGVPKNLKDAREKIANFLSISNQKPKVNRGGFKMKVEGFVASLKNAETIAQLFKILEEKGAPVIELDEEKFLTVVEGDFEGVKFWTEINGKKANMALGDAMLNSASFPFKCKKPYTGGNIIFVKMSDIESEEFLVAYKSEGIGNYFHVKGDKVEKIEPTEYEELLPKMPEFRVKSFSEEQMDMMGAFFG